MTTEVPITHWLPIISLMVALVLGTAATSEAVVGKVPQPNAFDCYVEASKLVVASIGKSSDPSDLDRRSELSREQQEALLRKNEAALKKLREGFTHDCMVPPEVALDDANFPDFSKFRALGKVLRLESAVRSAHQDYPAAMDSLVDAMRLGADISRGGNMIEALVGMAVTSVGRVPAFDLVDRLDGPQAKAAAKRAEDMASRVARAADVLRVEREFGRALLKKDFAEQDWRASIARVSVLFEDDEPDPKLVAWLEKRSKSDVSKQYEDYMSEIIARAKMPYILARRQPEIPENPYTSYMAVVKPGFIFEYRNTENTFLAAALALQARRMDQQSFPMSLSELIPQYLRAVPVDPFSNHEPLRYRRDGERYVLYSIGPDGKDDGGNPIKTEEGVYVPNTDSKGDIVYQVTEH